VALFVVTQITEGGLPAGAVDICVEDLLPI